MTDKTTVGDVAGSMADAVIAKVNPTQKTGIDLYSRFAFAGAVCCGVTHGALTPVDV